MKKVGIREARQSLSALIEDVKKGREIVITDRGCPVARLVPLSRPTGMPFPDLARFRKTMPRLKPPLSGSILRTAAIASRTPPELPGPLYLDASALAKLDRRMAEAGKSIGLNVFP